MPTVEEVENFSNIPDKNIVLLNKQISSFIMMKDDEICRFFNGIVVVLNKPSWFSFITCNAQHAKRDLQEVLELLRHDGYMAFVGPKGFPILKKISV